MSLFKTWAVTNKVFELPTKYRNKEKQTYGSAFKYKLSITQKDRKKSINWTGDSFISDELKNAKKKLIELCKCIQKSRLRPD